MNKVILIGRFVRDPEVRYSQQQMAVARFTLAVDRKFHKENAEQTADFIQCVGFSKTAEFIEKYFRQGMKIAICGHIQSGSYTNKDGNRVYTLDVIVDECEFVEKKNSTDYSPQPVPNDSDGFMNIPDELDDELPFN